MGTTVRRKIGMGAIIATVVTVLMAAASGVAWYRGRVVGETQLTAEVERLCNVVNGDHEPRIRTMEKAIVRQEVHWETVSKTLTAMDEKITRWHSP